MLTPFAQTLQAIINAHENPFVLIDENYQVVAANSAYQLSHGVKEGEIVGRYCYEVSHHRDSPCSQHGEDCPHDQVFIHSKNCQMLHTHYDRHGQAEHVQIKGYVIPRPDGGKLLAESIFRLAGQQDLDCDEMRLIGRSPAFLHAVEQLAQAADSNANILLHGESGVGKELAAHYMHQNSGRKEEPFLAVDCAAISEHLFESEMFGHERGAFTGCVGSKKGLFELAHGGTLFLDEIGELPASMQAKLLRVLESGQFRRVGGRETLHAEVRVIGATNRNLMQMVEAGTFREDLYYRLACIAIELPSLRARRSDIPALAEALLARINQANQANCYLTGEAMDKLMNYDYPGNVRELRNIMQRAVALCSSAVNGAIHGRGIIFGGGSLGSGGRCAIRQESDSPAPAKVAGDLPSMRDMEARYIGELLERYAGQRRLVAQALGISERTLYRKLRLFGLKETARA